MMSNIREFLRTYLTETWAVYLGNVDMGLLIILSNFCLNGKGIILVEYVRKRLERKKNLFNIPSTNHLKAIDPVIFTSDIEAYFIR